MNPFTYKREMHFRNMLEKFSTKEKNFPSDILNKIKTELDKNYETYTVNNIKCILKKLELRRYYSDIPIILKKLNHDNQNNMVIQQNNNKSFECSICLQTDIKNISKLKCNHSFCKICIEKIIEDNKIKCPLCRREYIVNIIETNELTDDQINELMEEYEKAYNTYNKIKETNPILNNRKNFLSYNYLLGKLAHLQNINIDTGFQNFNCYERQKHHDEIWKKITEEMDWKFISE